MQRSDQCCLATGYLAQGQLWVKSAAARSSAKGAKQSRTGHSSMSSFHLIYFALLILAMGGVGEGATHPVDPVG